MLDILEAEQEERVVALESYRVRGGDSLTSIAAAHGRDWRTLWEHPRNARLRDSRGDPETLLPGDIVFIPPKRERRESCPTGQRSRFVRRGVPVRVAFTVKGQDGHVFGGKNYVLVVGHHQFEGATDSDGRLEHVVPPDAKKGLLTVTLGEPDYPEQITWELEVGHLPPFDTLLGAQRRLNNLGFPCPTSGSALDDATRSALQRFQAQEELPASGEPDSETLARLREVHGS